MGCAASSDSGNESLGYHWQTVREDNNTRTTQHTTIQHHTRTTQQITIQHQTQQKQQQQLFVPQQTQQQPQQHKPAPNEGPPPYEQKEVVVPAIPGQPNRASDKNGPVAIKIHDAKSGVDFYNTDNMITPGFPDFKKAKYIPTDIGTYEMFLDFRTSAEDFHTREKPEIDGGLYTDYDFTVDVAFPNRSDLEWKRPQEICEAPVLFSEGTTRFDIGQGEVGTCWFLAMVANIADKPRLLRRVIPDDAYKIGTDEYDGIFHCRFWRFGVWNDVYIDDFLPVQNETQIFGAHSATDPNEMWVAFIEKAFAKLYGSFTAVTSGQTADSFMNLTGGVAEYIEIKKRKGFVIRLFSRLHNAFQCPTTMVGCTVPAKHDRVCGLVGSHCYSMNGAYIIGGNKLVRIRNPWGKREWKGAWSDRSKEWKSAPPDCIPPPVKDDGEFYMDIHDFVKYFEDCTICNLTPDFDRDGNPDMLNYVTTCYGNWREGKMGGSQDKLNNPRFCITMSEKEMDEDGKVPLVVQLIQRTSDRQHDITNIRCDLFKVLAQNDRCVSLELLGDKSNIYNETMQETYRFLVEPGTYVAIPSTLEPGYEKEFLIRFFTAGPVSNPHELDDVVIMTGNGRNGDDQNPELDRFKWTTSVISAFQCGFNAGGDCSCSGFSNNPQCLLTVHDTQTFRVEVMQPEQDGGFALGIKLFSVEGPTCFPVDNDWLMDNYDNAVRDNSGGDGAFMFGPSTDVCYTVDPGCYILLVHGNNESNENDFSIAIYAEQPIETKYVHMN